MNNKSANFSVNNAIKEYLPLMHELVIRLDLVAMACNGKLNLPPIYAREYSYLQFRYMCELIALGCLQLHGDLPIASGKKTENKWNAAKIMQQLHNYYPHAFPQSTIRETVGLNHSIKFNSKPNALTRDEFKELYNECGEVLHKGTIRKASASFLGKQPDYQRVIDWQSKLVDLMNEHAITRPNGKGLYLTSLKTVSGYPECSICTFDSSGGMKIETKKMEIVQNVMVPVAGRDL
jgi:hypothetical protein